MFNKWKKTKSYLFNKLGELPMGGGFSPTPAHFIFLAVGEIFKFLAKPAVQLGLFVAQGVMAHRQAMKAKRTGAEILLQKYGTGAGMPVIYGTRRVAGTVVYMNTTNNKELFVVYAIAGHEIDSFDLESLQIDGRTIKDTKIYRQGYDISDGTTRIAFRPSGETRTSGTFWGNTSTERANITGGANTGDNARMTFNCHKGANNQTADPMLSGIISEWTSDHKLSGITYIAANYEYDIQGMFTGIPNLTVVVNGKKVYDPRTTNTTFSSNPALCLLDYLTDDEYGKGLSLTNDIDTASFSTAANDCDVSADTITHSSIVVENANTSTDILRLANANEDDFNNFKVGNTYTVTDGVTTYISAKKLIDKDVTEIDNDGSTAFTLLKLKFEDGAVDNAISSNTTCTFTETQIRFDCNGVLDTDETVLENTKLLVANMRGIFTYSNGKYSIKVEGTESSVVTLDEDDILESGITLSLENKEAKYNKVEAEFYNAQKKYETDTTYYTGETSDTFLSDDGNEVLETRIQLPFCTNQRIAYNHAKAMLKRSRSQKTISFVATPKVLKAKVGEVISVTNSNLNLSSEQYRITNMVINPDLNISVNAIEYQTAIYGYVTPPNEEIGIGQDPVIGNRVEAPSSLTFTNKNATTGEPAKLTWTDSSKYPSYEFRVQIIDGVKTRYDRRVKDTTFYLDGISIANGYQAKVSAINALGVESDTTDITVNVTTAPITTVDIGQGSIGGFSFDASKMYHGTGTFNNTNTAVYIDDSGQFSLKDKLSFDGTTLNISGNLTVENTITADKIVVDGINLDNLISASTQSGSIYLTEFTGIKIATAGATNGYPALLRMQDDQGTNTFTDITQSQTGINIRARANTAQGTIRFQGIGSGITPVNYGGFDASGNFEIGTTDVITSARNLTNIVNGTLTGTLDVSGNVTFFDETADAHHSLTLQKRYNKETAIKWARGSDVDAQIRVGDGENLFIDYNHSNTGDSVIFRNNSSEVARFNSSGNFGIGTDSPSANLHVESSAPEFRLSQSGTAKVRLRTSGDNYINTGQNVGIGKTAPVAKLDVAGQGSGTSVFYYDYAQDSGIRVHGEESAIDLVGSDANSHASSILFRNANEGFGFINNSTSNRFELKSFNATADDFRIHASGTRVSNLTTIAVFEKTGNTTFNYDLTVTGDLTVNGTTTTLNTATLDVEDKNITLNYSTGDSSSSANGAGITIQDAVNSTTDATILWDATNDKFDFSHSIQVPDNANVKVGSAGDLFMVHNGSNSFIQNKVGGLYIEQATNDGNMIFRNDDGSGGLATYMALEGGNERVSFSKPTIHTDNIKANFGTGSDFGIKHDGSHTYLQNSTGHVYFQQLADDMDIVFQSDNGSGGVAEYLRIDGGAVTTFFSKNTRHTDNIRATFGNSSDLQIYHNGSHSNIQDTGTGNLRIAGSIVEIAKNDFTETMAKFTEDGASELYHNGTKKFETTSGGVDVTGEILATSTITSNGKLVSTADGSEGGHLLLRANSGGALQYSWDVDSSNAFRLIGEDDGTGNNGFVIMKTGSSGQNIRFQKSLRMINTEFMDTSRNMSNIGTISSGAITASGVDNLLYLQSGATGTPTLRFEQGTTRRAFLRYQNANSNFDIINEYGGVAIWTGTSGSESQKVLVNSSGRVGIGTASPNYLLDVEGTGSTLARLNSTSGSALLQISVPDTTSICDINFGDTGHTQRGQIRYRHNGDSLAFSTAQTEALRIDSSQRVGIGTTSPATKLEVAGNITLPSDGQIKFRGTNHYPRIFASSNNLLVNVDNGSGTNFTALTIDNGGTTTLKGGTADTSDHALIVRNSSSTALFSIRNDGRIDVGGSQILDISRNMSNIGTISSGAITSSGQLYVNTGDGVGSSGGIRLREGSNQSHRIYPDNQYQYNSIGSSDPNWIWLQEGGAQNARLYDSGFDLKQGDYKVNDVTVINSSRQLRNITAMRIGATEIIDSSRNLTNIGTYSGSGNLSTTGRITATGGRFQSTTTDNSHREYVLTTGSGGGDFFLGQIEYNDAADGAITGCIYFAYDYGTTTESPKIHFSFAQRNGTARGSWWYEHDDDAAGSNNVKAVLIDDGSGGMFVWIRVGDYARVAVVAETRHGGNWASSGSLTAGTITTGTTLFDTSNDPTSEHHIGKLFAHDGASFTTGNRDLDIILADSPSTGNVGVQLRAGASDYLGLAAGGGTGIGLVVDSSNRVGIGTSSPADKLHVDGRVRTSTSGIALSDTNAVIYRNSNDLELITYGGFDINLMPSNNVGIGTRSPKAKLHVANSATPTFNTDTHAGESIFVRAGGGTSSGDAQAVIGFGKADGTADRTGSAIASVQTDTDVDKVGLGFYTSGSSASTQTMTQKVLITHDGSVGIGQTSPATKLDVGGFMRTTLGAVFQGASNLSTGIGLEVGYNSSLVKGFLQGYDRTNSSYIGINYDGTSHTFLINGSSAFNITSSGTGAVGTLSGQALKASVYGISIGSTEVISSARNLTNIGTISSGAITSSNILTVDYTAPIIRLKPDNGAFFQLRANESPARLELGHSNNKNLYLSNTGNATFNYDLNVVSNFKINGTTVIDSSRNLSNIGTISSGAITAKSGSTTTQSTFSNFISNNTVVKAVVNHANEYGLYMGYVNATTDTNAIQSGRANGTTDELSLNPFGGSVGIGTTTPASSQKLDVAGKIRASQDITITNGDLIINQESKGIRMLSANGTEYLVFVNNSGQLVVEEQ